MLSMRTRAGRYRALILFILAFVLIVISVLGLNYYLSALFESDGQEINIAGRQRMLSQRTVKSLQSVLAAQQAGQDVSPSLDELRSTFDLFDRTLKAFSSGGETTGTQGEPVQLKAAQSQSTRQAVNQANQIWRSYRPAIAAVVDSDDRALQDIADATKLAVTNSDQLLAQMNELTGLLELNNSEPLLINLAGRQRMLSQRITKSLLELSQPADSDLALGDKINALQSAVSLFDETLRAFQNGGIVTDTVGSRLRVNALDGETVQQVVTESLEVWDPIAASLQKVVSTEIASLGSLINAVSAAGDFNLDLLKLMNDLTVGLEQDSTARANVLRFIQVAGILAALMMFGVIVFYFIRQLGKSDAEVNAARAETERILGTVNEGLFLMDTQHMIGNQHSDSLPSILNIHNPAGKSFLGILRKIVPEKTLTTAKEYFDLLLGERVNEELVTDLNPLDEVEVYFDSGEGDHQIRHLGFGFKRVKVDNVITHLLVQVNDITERVNLQRDLAESQEKAKAQFDLMLKVLHVRPDLLNHFLSGTESSLLEINTILEQRAMGSGDNKNKIEKIYRIIHGVKGDAAALSLDVFEQKAHEFENILEQLKERDEVSGKDFLPLTIRLDDFLKQIESLRELILKLGNLQQSLKETDGQPDFDAPVSVVELPNSTLRAQSVLSTTIRQLADRVAADENKNVDLEIRGEELIPEQHQRACKDILIQLTRNAIVHGIENEEQRSKINKAPSGKILVDISKNDTENLKISFRDDGRGLLTDQIVRSAVSKGVISQQQADTLLPKQVVGLIFKPGFSTHQSTNKNAGRGVGMDLIATMIKKLGGQIGVKSVAGKFCEFVITLPAKVKSDKTSTEVA